MTFDTRILTGVGVLAAVVEAGNFARAGEALGLTPSGVSRAVARLEARVGVRLFDRTPRAATLTEEGRRFYGQVTPLLAGIEEAAGEAAGAAATVAGRLRANIDPWFARIMLAPNLQRFLGRYPALSLDLVVSNHREEMMTGVDVAARFGPLDDASLVARKILETRVITAWRLPISNGAACLRRRTNLSSTRRSCSVIPRPGAPSPGATAATAMSSRSMSAGASLPTILPRRSRPV